MKFVKFVYLALILLAFPATHFASQSQPPFRIGLNFAFVGLTNIADNFTNLAPLGLRGTRHSAPGDVNWTSIQQNSNAPFNFSISDQVFFNTNGVMPIATFYDDPNSTSTFATGLQVPWIAGSGFNFTSNELFYASNYVRNVVTHYSGVTHLWEISNELNGITNLPKSLPPAQFASFMVTNRNWMRALDSNATVLLPGCLGNYGYPFASGYTWLRQLLTNLNTLGAAGFDVMNYHDYKSWWVLAADYEGYRSVLAEFNLTNTPIWITECSSASTNTSASPPYASEDQQAADVWRRSCVLFGRGASVWFWHALYSSQTGGFAHQGLLTPVTASPSAQKKKSWHSFKLLVEKIEGFQTATSLSVFTNQTDNTNGGGGQWAVQFDWNDGTRRFVAWSGTNLNYTLTNLDSNASPYRVTTVVPASLSANGETATFIVTTNVVPGNSLALTGTNLPVLIESTLTPFQIWANTYITNSALRGTADDADADGQNNYAEYLAGTDPGNANSVFKLNSIHSEGANRRIYWSSATNKTYSILRSTNLQTFAVLQTNLIATPPLNNWLDTNSASQTVFYRIRLD